MLEELATILDIPQLGINQGLPFNRRAISLRDRCNLELAVQVMKSKACADFAVREGGWGGKQLVL